MCQLRVDFLRHDAVAVHQVLWLVVEKTRIGTQEFSEVMEAAFEPGGRDDFIHLRPDALYFGETDFVNLLRRRIAFLQALLKEHEILLDVFWNRFKPNKNVFVFRSGLVWHGG